MATLILGAVGGLLGPVGSAVGALVGSYIDSNFILPALFPVQPSQGPRLDEFKLQTQDEGSAGNTIFGSDARVAGTVIWAGNIIEEKHTDRVGGKGGGGGARVTTYEYFVDVAVAYAIFQTDAVKKTLLEGKLLYNSTPNVSLASTLFVVTVEGSGTKKRMRITSPNGGPDLSKLMAGFNTVIAGFVSGGNNGTFQCVSSSKDTSTGISTALFKNTGAVAESAGASVTIDQVLPNFDPKKVQQVTFYQGDQSQTPDPIIEAYKGTGLVPGFRGTSYTVERKLALRDYGNRLPNHAFIVDGHWGDTVATTIDKMLELAKLQVSEYDTSGLAGANQGYAYAGPQPTVQTLQPLLLFHDVLEQEGNQQIRFFHRKDAKIIDVAEGDLGTYQDGNQPRSRPLEVEDLPDSELYDSITTKYLDFDKDGNTGSQNVRRNDTVTRGSTTIDLPIVMTGGKAIAFGRRAFWLGQSSRKLFRCSLPSTYYFVQENDVLRVPSAGNVFYLLVQKVDIGQNWVIEIECTPWQKSILTQSEEFDPPNIDPTFAPMLPVADGYFFELPPLVPNSGSPAMGSPTLIVFPVIEDDDTLFPGILILEAPESSGPYVEIAACEEESEVGFTTTGAGGTAVLNGTGINHAWWDDVSTVDVYMISGSLESRPEVDVLNGANRAIVGKELVGFKTATLVGTKTYRLSGFIRGLRNTEDQMTTHVSEEAFVFLNAGGRAIELNLSSIGQTKYFKMVTPGTDPDDVPPESLLITGATLRPFSPCDLQAAWDGSGDVVLSWKRRSRALYRLFSPLQPPIAEESEKYDAEVEYPIGSSTIVKSWTDLTSPTVAFPSGEHGAIPTGAPFTLHVWQKSTVLGRGKEASATV